MVKWRFDKFTENTIKRGLTLKQEWKEIIDFLQRELRIKEKILLNEKSRAKAREENLGDTKRQGIQC